LKDRPAVLYKYLDATGAKAFLEKPQLQHRAFEKLDDICDSLPAFSTLSEDLALQNAIERASRDSLAAVALEKQILFYRQLGMRSPADLERMLRDLISQGHGPTLYICSMVARAGFGLALERHSKPLRRPLKVSGD